MKFFRSFLALSGILTCDSLAVLPNAWHIPDNSIVSGNGGATPSMRSPRVEFGDTGTVRVFSGLQKFDNPGYGTANQTGGTLFYKSADQGAWSSTGLSFHANNGNDQFWYGDITLTNVTADKVIQYYLFLTFDSGAENAYIHGGGDQGGSQVTNNNGAAAAAPFTVRNRPAWVFHANNRVVSGYDVQFWTKIGYISDENNLASRWANSGAVYYTTDGSTPAGSLGVGSGTTQVALCSYSHPESNNQGSQSPAGTPMWWVSTAPNLLQGLPLGTTIKYKIGFWHSDNNEEKFADYQAGNANQIFSFTNGTLGDPAFTVTSASSGTLSANYTTSKLFVDEIAGDSLPVTFNFNPGEDATEVELVTNLNQRDYATADKNSNGIDDGMEFNQTSSVIGSGADYYYRSFSMSGPSLGNYTLVLNAQKTGAYRVTARWKVEGDPNWRWYTNDAAGRRDHAISVSPKDARDIALYEINTLTVEAKDNGSFIERSTFEDLFDAANAPRTADGRGFNLDYLTGLGVNWLWFQPIHPPAVDGRETDPATSQPYNPGSPYAVKNFFEVNPWMSANFTNTEPGGINGTTARQKGMESFQAFVGASDTEEVGIMLDAPFNHTGYDVEFGPEAGLFQRFGDSLSPSTEIRSYETRFFSRTNDYAQRATLAPNEGPAVAPDRGDFGKWNDVKDVYFGRYDALVNTNPADNGNYLNERDRFYYDDGNWTSADFYQGAGNTEPRNVTKLVWKYFARYATHWLEKTRPAGQNRNSSTEPGLSTAQRYEWDKRGIDGLRCDFGQGLPPQAWEYMINFARSKKWNFVMMAESLDGGAVTYRSNRHFDILNENIVFPLKNAGNSTDYRSLFEGRRNAYGQGLVLLNNTSHDEENYENIWHPLMRYNVSATVDGAPMIFMGQELGVTRTSGFTFYETNFGKQVAHFKKFNSMQPAWLNRAASPFGEQFLWDAFSAAGQARKFSPALRSSNRYYLNRKSDGLPKDEIWAVAKYEQPNTSPNLTDVVFAYVNLRTEQGPSDTFDLNITANGSNLFGIKPGRVYNVKNIAAYTKIDPSRRNYWLWPDQDAGPASGIPGNALLANGVFVSLNSLPSNNSGWTGAPWEAQFLKLYDVTQPPAPTTPAGPNVYAYAIGNTATFTWTPAADPEGGVSGYHLQVGTTPGGTNLFNANTTTTSQSVGGLTYGSVIYAQVSQINNAGIEGPFSSSSVAIEVLDPVADRDGDGQSNAAEQSAGTNPLDAASLLRATAISRSGNDVLVTVSTVIGKTYQLETSTTLATGDWQQAGTPVTASGTSTIFTHPNGAGDARRFYRARVVE